MNNYNILNFLTYIFSGLAILLFVESLNAFLFYQSRLIFKMCEEKDLFNFFLKKQTIKKLIYDELLCWY